MDPAKPYDVYYFSESGARIGHKDSIKVPTRGTEISAGGSLEFLDKVCGYFCPPGGTLGRAGNKVLYDLMGISIFCYLKDKERKKREKKKKRKKEKKRL